MPVHGDDGKVRIDVSVIVMRDEDDPVHALLPDHFQHARLFVFIVLRADDNKAVAHLVQLAFAIQHHFCKKRMKYGGNDDRHASRRLFFEIARKLTGHKPERFCRFLYFFLCGETDGTVSAEGTGSRTHTDARSLRHILDRCHYPYLKPLLFNGFIVPYFSGKVNSALYFPQQNNLYPACRAPHTSPRYDRF